MNNNKNKLFLQISSGVLLSIIFTIFSYFLGGFFAFKFGFSPYQFFFYFFPLSTCVSIIVGNTIGRVISKHNFQKPKKAITVFSLSSLLILLMFLFLALWA